MFQTRPLIHWLMFIGLVVFWGSSFAITRIVVETVSPEWVAALRLLFGALTLYLMVRISQTRMDWTPVNLKWFTWLGFIGSALPFLLISWGSLHISSGLVGILMALVPITVLILAHFLLPDEKLTRYKFFGFLLGFIGLALLLSPELFDQSATKTNGWLTLLAVLAILLATLSYATQAVTSRLSPKLSPLEKAAGTHIIAAILVFIFALFLNPTGLASLDFKTLVYLVILGVFPTAFAGYFLFYLLEYAGARFVAMSNYLVSPFAYGLGLLMLNEPFYVFAAAGMLIILVGIAVSEQK